MGVYMLAAGFVDLANRGVADAQRIGMFFGRAWDFVKAGAGALWAALEVGWAGAKVPIYGRDSGLYSIRDLDERNSLPPDARIVQFNGPTKPWDYRGPATWVAEHWGRG